MRHDQRTIVLGFDGIDAKLTAALIAAGALPKLGELAAKFGFRRVLSTTPAESAVAWTSFNYGANPGQTNVFDFVDRSPSTYMPRLAGSRSAWEPAGPSPSARWGATAAAVVAGGAVAAVASRPLNRRVTRRAWLRATAAAAGGALGFAGGAVSMFRWLPWRAQRIHSLVVGEPWWDRLSRSGGRCVALRVPLTFPAKAAPGVRLLAGLGVPDLAGTNGRYRILTDAADGIARADRVLPLAWEGEECVVRVPGPEDGIVPDRRAHAEVRVRRQGADAVSVSSGGESQVIRRGGWSSWLPLEFEVSPIARERGVARFHFRSSAAGVTLYMTPVEFDPARPPDRNPISSPKSFASELCHAVGRYRTIGWETQTWGLVDNVLDEEAYLADFQAALTANENQLGWLLSRDDWDHLMLVAQVTDQASHMFFDDRAVSMRGGGAVVGGHPLVGVYRRMDEIVGKVAASAAERGCRLVIMSDHGFARYRRSVNVNTFLAHMGWLALRDRTRWDPPDADALLSGRVWGNVDWFNTRAYGIGLGGIYLNVAGREAEGIVKPGGEYEFLQGKLAAALLEWRDPVTGQAVLANVYRAQDVYSGAHAGGAPDLILGFNEGYRVSSASAVGGIPEEQIVDNNGHWVGDHCGIDAPLIPGICLTNFSTNWPDLLPIETLQGRIWPQADSSKS